MLRDEIKRWQGVQLFKPMYPKQTMHEIFVIVERIRCLPPEKRLRWKSHKEDTPIRLATKRMVMKQWLDEAGLQNGA